MTGLLTAREFFAGVRVVLTAMLAASATLMAQASAPQPPLVETVPSSVNYFFPEAPPDANTFSNRFFTVRAGVAAIADYTFIGYSKGSSLR